MSAAEKKKNAPLNAVSRDIVAIVAAILTLSAFAFAIWGTVRTFQLNEQSEQQAKRYEEVTERLQHTIERRLDAVIARCASNNRS